MLEDEIKPIWTTSSFLVYTGGLTVLGAAGAGLVYLARRPAATSRVRLVVPLPRDPLRGRVALLCARRWWRPGSSRSSSVIVWGVFVVLLFMWFGWDGVKRHRLIDDWSCRGCSLWLLDPLVAASVDRRVFRFPFIRADLGGRLLSLRRRPADVGARELVRVRDAVHRASSTCCSGPRSARRRRSGSTSSAARSSAARSCIGSTRATSTSR